MREGEVRSETRVGIEAWKERSVTRGEKKIEHEKKSQK